MKIWKFPLPLPDQANAPIVVSMPKYARLLHVDRDPAGLDPALWAFVEPSAPLEDRTFHILGTGRDIPDGLEHCGTVIIGDFVWHVFELPIQRNLGEMLADLFTATTAGGESHG